MEKANAQLTRATEYAQAIAQSKAHKAREHTHRAFSKGQDAKAIESLRLDKKSVFVSSGRLINVAKVPTTDNSKNTPQYVMSGNDHHIEAVIEDYLRNRWGSPLESVPFRYKETKPPDEGFSKLIHEWAKITHNSPDPGSPHHADIKSPTEMLASSSPTAKGMNELMQPIRKNLEKFKKT